MKEKIGAGLNEKIVYEAQLNEKSLLQVVQEDASSELATVHVRYITSGCLPTTKKSVICHILPYGVIEECDGITSYYTADGTILEYNDKGIACYRKDAKTDIYYLNEIYDLEYQEFLEGDYFETMYQKYFMRPSRNKTYIKKNLS